MLFHGYSGRNNLVKNELRPIVTKKLKICLQKKLASDEELSFIADSVLDCTSNQLKVTSGGFKGGKVNLLLG